MWTPRKWSDLERAIDIQSEDDAFDFKREVPPKGKVRDLAKDFAAMSIGGGVIVIGMDESGGVASAITPVRRRAKSSPLVGGTPGPFDNWLADLKEIWPRMSTGSNRIQNVPERASAFLLESDITRLHSGNDDLRSTSAAERPS